MTDVIRSQRDRPKIEDLKFGRRQYRCNWSAVAQLVQGWWLVYVDAEQIQWDFIEADSQCEFLGDKDLFLQTISETFTTPQQNRINAWLQANGFDTGATHPEGELSGRTVGSVVEEIHASIPETRGSVRNLWVGS